MLKKNTHRVLIIALIFLLTLPTTILTVSSSSGSIRVNGKTSSLSGQQVQAGGNVNLYFGDVVWSGSQFYMLASLDSNPQVSVSDVIYTPRFSISDLTNLSPTTYTSGLGTWQVGGNWVNGTVAQNIAAGAYTFKAFDELSGTVALTDVFVTVNPIIYSSSMVVYPSSGPGGVPIQFTGAGFPPLSPVTISYFDPSFNTWNAITTVTSNSTGGLTFQNTVPDLRKSLGIGDYPEAYMTISYRAEIRDVVYCYANYTQYERGLKRVGDQIASGLYGNGTDLSNSLNVKPGDSLTLSGRWFHPGDALYVRWDGQTVVGTVTGNEWKNAQIIGTSIVGSTGSFEVSVVIPEANAGVHFMSIEDSQTKVIVKVYASRASLALSPPSGPGGMTVAFTGEGYPASSPITISYKDPQFSTWNVFATTISDAQGRIQYSAEMPDLARSLASYDSYESSNPVSFRTEQGNNVYAFTDYQEYARGLKTVGNLTANGLYGNGTNLCAPAGAVSTPINQTGFFGNGTTLPLPSSVSPYVTVSPGDPLTISGKWFHPSDVVYIRWDGKTVVGTVTGNEWRSAQIIGQSIANGTGYFQATALIPDADPGEHYISVEDSQAKVIIKVSIAGAVEPLPTDRPSSAIDLSCTCTTTFIGYKVAVNGTLRGDQTTPIPGASVTISYSSDQGNTWQYLTSVSTDSDGKFSTEWMPSASGTYLVTATWSGNAAYTEASQTVTLAAVSYSDQNVFSVTSNSTITQLSFNSENSELNFVVSGESGTTGTVDVAIAKTLIPDISTLKVYVDDVAQQYTVDETADSWFIHFSYSHSTHAVTLKLGAMIDPSATSTSTPNPETTTLTPTPAENPEPPIWLIIGIVAAIVAVATVLIISMKRRSLKTATTLIRG